MTITERLLVRQNWYETECTKNGFDSHGWEFVHFGGFDEDNWEVVEILDFDKFYNPVLGIAERTVETDIIYNY